MQLCIINRDENYPRIHFEWAGLAHGDLFVRQPAASCNNETHYERDKAIVKKIDKGVRNKFCWLWLQKTLTITVKIGQNTQELSEKLANYIAKYVAGKAVLIL